MELWRTDLLAPVVSGHYAYTANGLQFRVFDIRGLPNLQQVGRLALPGEGPGLAVSGDFAYIAGENLEVIDISQPANPQRVGGCPGLGGKWNGQIAVVGGRACVVGDGMLRVFDTSEPSNPQMVGECTVPGLPWGASGVDIAMAGEFAYVAASHAGVEVLDIRVPAHPRRVGGNSAFDAHALAIADGRLHVAAGEQGLVILNLYQPPRFESLHLDRVGFHLLLRGATGQMMRLERSTDLLNWNPFATVPIPASGQTVVDPTATSEPFLFYRAVSVP
jgi:hypothetical protein